MRPIQVGRGIFDQMPLSVLSSATLAALEARLAGPVDLRRFRPNVVIDVADGKSRETAWLDGTLVFGDGPDTPRLRVNLAIDRCVMVTIDPDTAARDPAILRAIVEDFDNQIGARCAVERIGTIRTGDRVRLLQNDTLQLRGASARPWRVA